MKIFGYLCIWLPIVFSAVYHRLVKWICHISWHQTIQPYCCWYPFMFDIQFFKEHSSKWSDILSCMQLLYCYQEFISSGVDWCRAYNPGLLLFFFYFIRPLKNYLPLLSVSSTELEKDRARIDCFGVAVLFCREKNVNFFTDLIFIIFI